MNHSVATRQQLEEAFDLFIQVSRELAGSYDALQQQLSSLERKLAVANPESLHLIDEMRTMYGEIRRKQRLSSSGEMAARLSHQIRTPLSTALLYASQLKQANLRKEQHDCFVDRLLVGLRHLDHMVNDMLVFARGGEVGNEVVPVSSLLEQVHQTLLPRLAELDADWSLVEKSADIKVRGKREILASVLSNIATNTLDACGPGARLEWRIEVNHSEVCIALQDNGPGVPEEFHQQIFEPFFTTRAEGTGLGLAVVRAVIEAHHGHIEIDNQYRDGARFLIRLPVFDVHQQLPSEMVLKRNTSETAKSRCAQ